MKFKKILAYPLGWTWPLYLSFLRELRRREYFESATILTFNAKADRILKKELMPEDCIRHEFINLDAIQKINKPDFDRLEKEYGLPNLGLLRLIEYREFDSRLGLEDYFYFWEKYLSRAKPDLVILQDPATTSAITLYLVARKMDIQTIFPVNARFPGRTILLDGRDSGSLYDLWPGLQGRYSELKKVGLTPAERAAQLKKLQEIRNKKPKPYWFTASNKKKLSSRLLNSLATLSAAKIKRSFLMRWRKKFHKFGSKIIAEGSFLFFPLHYEPESSLDIWAPFFRHQLQLIEYVCQSLPAGVRLAIKEHPAMVGFRQKSFYKAITQLESTMLLDSVLDTYDIIKDENCLGVITINSTVGQEAVFWEKPVIVFGNAYYTIASDLATKVTDLTALPRVLFDLKYHKNGHPRHENLLSFLQAIEDLTFPGIVASGNPETHPELFSKENVTAIADEFQKRFPST